MLDEPTNHLDLRAVLWLEEYLRRWKKTLVVSHERDFLNTVCGEIIHLHDQKLHFYRGNLYDFETAYEQHCKEMNKFEVYEQGIEFSRRRLRIELNWLLQRKHQRIRERARLTMMSLHQRPQGNGETTVWSSASLNPTELTPRLLQLIEVSFSYPNREDFRLSDVDVGIDMGTRVAIVGPNGAGKSTLLNLLAGDLVPSEGEVGGVKN